MRIHSLKHLPACMALLALVGQTALAGVADLIAKFPVNTAAAREEICKELIKAGPAGVQELAKMLLAPGAGDDSKARHALSGLAIYTSRAGGESDRKMYSQALCDALETKLTPDAKIFLLEQLRTAAGEEAIAPLGKLLLDKELCDPAVQVLLALRQKEAAATIRAALPAAQGSVRATLAKALGTSGDRESVSLLIRDAGSADGAVKFAALHALAHISDPAATDVLLKASNAEPGPERSNGTQACVHFAEQLVKNQNGAAAAKVARELIRTHTDVTEQHVQCAALYPLTQALGEGAFDDLLAALKSDRYQVRAVALNLGASLPGETITKRWMEHLNGAQPDVRAGILGILAQRKDKAAFPATIAALKDSEKPVRLAAIQAMSLGEADAVSPLIGVLEKNEADEQNAARGVLVKLSGDAVNSKIAAAVQGASVPARKALLFVLGAREAKQSTDVVLAAAKDADASVRVEALNALSTLAGSAEAPALIEMLNKSSGDEQQAVEKTLTAVCQRPEDRAKAIAPVLAAVNGASIPVRSAMLRVLRRAGGRESLDAFRAALKEENADLLDVSVRELSEWPDDSALPVLLELARNAKKDNHNVLAIRGYLRIAALSSNLTMEDIFKLYSSALEVARRPDEKKLVIAAFGATKDPGALKRLDPFFEDPAFKEEAAAAYFAVAKAMSKTNPGQAEVALKKTIEATKNERMKKEAQESLTKLGK